MSGQELGVRVERELRRRYPDYDGEPSEHPEYQEIRAEIVDYLADMWDGEPWRTAEGEQP